MLIHEILQKLSQQTSLTRQESEFKSYIKKWVTGLGHTPVEAPGETIVPGLGVVQDTSIIFLAHLDRVPVKRKRFKIMGDYACGQLDNIIGVGAALYLLQQKDFKHSILFTTQEEIVANRQQIENFVKKHGTDQSVIIDLDIDPITTGTTLFKGLSIRAGDSAREYSKSVYNYIISLARRERVKYLSLDSWLILQISNLQIKNRVGFIGVPILNYHSNMEITYYSSIVIMYKFLDTLCKRSSLDVVSLCQEEYARTY